MKCNYQPKPLTKEEQAEFKSSDNRSTLPLIYRIKQWKKEKQKSR